MKKLIIAAMMLMGWNAGIQAQNVVREGKTFKQASKSRSVHKADTLVTTYTFEDSKGNTYPIIINKSTGSCYVWKKSSKSDKMYKQYMKSEVSQEIAGELGIEYKPKNNK